MRMIIATRSFTAQQVVTILNSVQCTQFSMGVLATIEWILYSIPEARNVARKNFQGLSPTKEVIAEMSTHLLYKRLHYVLSVNWIHTIVECFLG